MIKTTIFCLTMLIILMGLIFCSCIGQGEKEILKDVTITVDGMHCNACAEGLTAVLGKLEGIKEAKVTYEPNEAVIKFDESKVKIEDIFKKIEDAGYSGKIKKNK